MRPRFTLYRAKTKTLYSVRNVKMPKTILTLKIKTEEQKRNRKMSQLKESKKKSICRMQQLQTMSYKNLDKHTNIHV